MRFLLRHVEFENRHHSVRSLFPTPPLHLTTQVIRDHCAENRSKCSLSDQHETCPFGALRFYNFLSVAVKHLALNLPVRCKADGLCEPCLSCAAQTTLKAVVMRFA